MSVTRAEVYEEYAKQINDPSQPWNLWQAEKLQSKGAEVYEAYAKKFNDPSQPWNILKARKQSIPQPWNQPRLKARQRSKSDLLIGLVFAYVLYSMR
jgi:hypothetical protein